MAEIRGFYGSVDYLEQLQRQLEDIGKLPKASLTKASKAAMQLIQADARANAPTVTGMLKRGIKFKMETPNKRNKSVYRLNWDTKFTDTYRKPIKNVGMYGGVNANAYYPQSVEWGFLTAHGKKEGRYFVRSAMERNESQTLQTLIDVLSSEIERLTTR